MDWKEIGTALAALLVGVGAFALRARSSDSAERLAVAKDEAETRIISRLEEERDFAREEARRERDQRVAEHQRLAKLEAENAFLKSYARRIMRALPERERAIYETDFQPLDETPHARLPGDKP
jgi:hypothetical protein